MTSELVPVLALVLLVPLELEMNDASLGEVCQSRLVDDDDMVAVRYK